MNMRDYVIIKSYPNGLNLILDPEAKFERILTELAEKLQQGKQFFGKAAVALNIEGRMLSPDEEALLLDVIRRNSQMKVFGLTGVDCEQAKAFQKAYARYGVGRAEPEIYIHRGDVVSDERIEEARSVLVLGDVKAGGVVTSEGSILVLGALLGEAHLLEAGERERFVAALSFDPEYLTIRGSEYHKAPSRTAFGKRKKPEPICAYYQDGSVVAKPLDSALLSSL